MRNTLTFFGVFLIIVIGTFIFFHQKTEDRPVVIAYQTGVDPSKIAQASQAYEKNTHQKIIWKKFDTGSDVINALASGDVDIGNIGSSPFAAASSKNLPIEAFLIASKLGSSEALVVHNNESIKTPQDLVGKKIAVPFVSTTHYSLLSALKKWGISEQQVQIVNLRPPEIIAAWQRKDIDAAYVWEPALSQIKTTGHVLVDSKEVATWGHPTFDLWVVRKDFAKTNPNFLQSFVDTTVNAFKTYTNNPVQFIENKTYLTEISQLTGSNAQDIPLLLAGNQYLNKQEQYKLLTQDFAKNITDTALFLKSQDKLDQVKPNYQDNINANFVK